MVFPASGLVEEVSADVGAGATRNGPTMDIHDWFGVFQVDFPSANQRAYGFPFLDLAVKSPAGAVGALDVYLQYATETLPATVPPTLTFSDFALLVSVPVGSWVHVAGYRLANRFSRLSFRNPGAAGINGIYIYYRLAGN